ncbi:MAG: molecular chaperone DnaJ, partial [Elusimicrobia bacterium CG11_big_fil_rev_8_21_14_0_20_64_6]
MAIEHKDYYGVLGVKKDASPDEIKHAYRRLAKQHHPDLHTEKNKPQAETKFKSVNEAYEVLSNPQNRAKYDQLGPDWEKGRQPGPASSGDEQGEPFTGYGDFFESMFRNQGDQGFRRQQGFQGRPRKGQAVEAELPLSLEDSITGGDKRLTILAPILCPACGGSGRQGNRTCPTCGGVGETRQERAITVHLPKLSRDGMKLRLRGQGGPAARGEEAGDLFLRIRLLPHPVYKVSDNDLETTVTAMPWEASLGGEVEVFTLEGPIRIRIPAGTHSGRRLRLAGKGLGKADGTRGDLYAAIRIDIPEKAN